MVVCPERWGICICAVCSPLSLTPQYSGEKRAVLRRQLPARRPAEMATADSPKDGEPPVLPSGGFMLCVMKIVLPGLSRYQRYPPVTYGDIPLFKGDFRANNVRPYGGWNFWFVKRRVDVGIDPYDAVAFRVMHCRHIQVLARAFLFLLLFFFSAKKKRRE